MELGVSTVWMKRWMPERLHWKSETARFIVPLWDSWADSRRRNVMSKQGKKNVGRIIAKKKVKSDKIERGKEVKRQTDRTNQSVGLCCKMCKKKERKLKLILESELVGGRSTSEQRVKRKAVMQGKTCPQRNSFQILPASVSSSLGPALWLSHKRDKKKKKVWKLDLITTGSLGRIQMQTWHWHFFSTHAF